MNSRARIITIIAVSIAVPVLAIWQRWSEIRVFARQLQIALTQSADTGEASSPYPSSTHLNGASTAADLAAAGDWPGAIDQVLSSNGEPAVVSAQLLDLLPQLPETGKSEALQHVTNLLPDKDYAPLSQMLANPETSEAILDVLLADLLNRGNGVKLPALLEVARTPDHARAQLARQILQPYVEEDYGDDWAKCLEKLNQWLKDHPDS